MSRLPNSMDVTAAQGSEWSYTLSPLNPDGTPISIVGKTFEFVIRRSVADTGLPLVKIDQTPGASGVITVDTGANTVTVTVTATATALLVHGGGAYTLWMNPGQSDAVALLAGVFYAMQVAAP